MTMKTASPVHIALFALTILFALSGCADSDPQDDFDDPDAGAADVPDATPEHDVDADISPDPEVPDIGSDVEDDIGDAEVESDVEPDVDEGPIIIDDETHPASAPTLIEPGSDGFLLRGTVLAPDEVLDPGEVLVDGELIVCVDVDCTAEAEAGDFAIVETEGVISPGLIDAHNHLPYNFLPPWFPNPETTFNNRYEWADEAAYREHIAPYGDNRNRGTHYCPAAKWGELRSLVHATTTIQGQSFQQRCVDWGVRNADHYHGLQHNHMRTTIASPRDITDDQADNYIESFEAENNPTTRLAVHMAEGHSGSGVEDEFDSFAGRDPRENRHAGVSLLEHGTALLIHAIPLTTPQLEEVYLTNSRIVWSPSSNFQLYGDGVTAPIEEMLEWNITTALGPDWTISGAFDMLQEMRVAKGYGLAEDIEALTPERIWRMATIDGAEAVGLEEFIGRIEPGYHADLAIFGRYGDDPYRAVLDSRSEDVELVLIDGDAYFGDQALDDAARNDYCDSFDACGKSKFLCAKEGPGADDRGDERVDDIRAQLIDILEGRDDAPPEEQYDRADDLLDLVICGL